MNFIFENEKIEQLKQDLVNEFGPSILERVIFSEDDFWGKLEINSDDEFELDTIDVIIDQLG